MPAEGIIDDESIKFKGKVSERALIILVPSLGCPGIVDNGKLQVVALLKHTAKFPPKREYLSDCLRYLHWDKKDGNPDSGQKFQPTDIEIRDYVNNFEPLNYMSPKVLEAYQNEGFTHPVYALCRVSGGKGLYNLVTTYDESSVMHKTIEKLPRPYTKAWVGKWWREDCPMMPDKEKTLRLDRKTPLKLYHPFLISNADYLGIAHVTDPHLSCRWELLHWRAKIEDSTIRTYFNNYNNRLVEILKDINVDNRIEIVIMTGDLIDYNRGHNGRMEPFGRNNSFFTDYLFNRNWLLFYKLLLENYRKPIFTILGNHEYRLNPYAPMPRVFWKELYSISYDLGLLRSEVLKIHESAHDIETGKNGNLYTTYESVNWYSIVVNPLFDYTFLYKKMAFAMFDWDRKEHLAGDLPWAEDCLSEKQQRILNRWLDGSKGKVRIVGMHTPVFSPFPEIGNKYLRDGVIYKSYPDPETELESSGVVYDLKTMKPVMMPIPIFKGWTYDRNELVNGTFRKGRNELIRRVLDNPNYGKKGNYNVGANPIQLILSGHVHRNGVYQVIGDKVKLTQHGKTNEWMKHRNLPIFVNTVSAGPLGYDNETGYAKQLDGLKHRYLVRAGYRRISFDPSGKVDSLEKKEAPQISPRVNVIREFQS